MFRKKITFIFLLLLMAFPISAQIRFTNSHEHDWDDEWQAWRGGRPYIETAFGFGKPFQNNFTGKFSKIGAVELKLGFYSQDEYYEEEILQFDERYFFISQLATRFHSDKRKLDELPSELIRFGFGKRNGYGYDFNSLKILPYHQGAVALSKLEMLDYPISIFNYPSQADAINDTEILKRYDSGYRFSTISEGGVRMDFGMISLNAGYEAAVIYPRYMFWKYLASFAIESSGLRALDNFIDEVLDASPSAGPIVNFVLKNAYSYCFFLLKKEKMNWPFNSETPLTYETFKVGITFTF